MFCEARTAYEWGRVDEAAYQALNKVYDVLSTAGERSGEKMNQLITEDIDLPRKPHDIGGELDDRTPAMLAGEESAAPSQAGLIQEGTEGISRDGGHVTMHVEVPPGFERDFLVWTCSMGGSKASVRIERRQTS